MKRLVPVEWKDIKPGDVIVEALDVWNMEHTVEHIGEKYFKTTNDWVLGRYVDADFKGLAREYLRLENRPQDCPFCGEKAHLWGWTKTYVQCENIKCKLSGPSKDTKEEAVDAWNSICLRGKDDERG